MDLGKTAPFLFVNSRVLFLKPHVCSPLVLPSERGLYSSFSIPSGMLHSHMLRGINSLRACLWDREAAATSFSWKPAFSVTVYYSSLKHVHKTFLREAGKEDRKLRYCCGLHTSVYNLPKYLFTSTSTQLKHEPKIHFNPDLYSMKCLFRKKLFCASKLLPFYRCSVLFYLFYSDGRLCSSYINTMCSPDWPCTPLFLIPAPKC